MLQIYVNFIKHECYLELKVSKLFLQDLLFFEKFCFNVAARIRLFYQG